MAAPAAASFVIGSRGTFGDVRVAEPTTPIEEEFGVSFDGGASRGVTAQHFANVVLRLMMRQLRGVPLTRVGGDASLLGDTWGSGTFNQMPYAWLPEIRFADGGNLILDRLEVHDLAQQYAGRVRASGIRYVGRLALPNGLQHAVRAENRRFSLRFCAYYEHRTGSMIGRFDVIGTAA